MKNIEKLKNFINFYLVAYLNVCYTNYTNSDEDAVNCVNHILNEMLNNQHLYHSNHKISRNIEIFRERYFKGKTYKEISLEYGISQNMVRIVCKKTMRRITEFSFILKNEEIRKKYPPKMDYDKLENLQLETRTYNVLMREGYTKIYEVVDDLENHPDKIKNLRNLGNKSFEDLVNKINKYKNNGEM